MQIPSISALNVQGQRLVVRADLNVPILDGRVSDATRITRFCCGMKRLLDQGASLVILTHLGRPNGVADAALSTEQLRPLLAQALGVPVKFAIASTGARVQTQAEELRPGQVMLCENLRFNAGEEGNDRALAAGYAALGDIYVNDAFSCAHRAHASIVGITSFLPAVAGPLMLEELNALSDALEAPQKPAVAIVGGAKVSTKIAVLKNLVQKLDAVIIGGAMANTFLFADGAPMGLSLYEDDQQDIVAEIRALAKQSGCRLVLPVDCAGAREFKLGQRQRIFDAANCPEDHMILDVGPKSLEQFEIELAEAKTVLWNGPLGAFEIHPFDQSTVRLAQRAAQLTRDGMIVSVAGGGDTVAALNLAEVTEDFTYVSTAGGAFLEWLEGNTHPGIAALQNAAKAA